MMGPMTLRELLHSIVATFYVLVDIIKAYAKVFWNVLLDMPLWFYGVIIVAAIGSAGLRYLIDKHIEKKQKK